MGKTKEEEAIEFIQLYEPVVGWLVGNSGGKDSTVLRDLVIKSGVKARFVYSATGIDPPEMVKFIKQHHPETEFHRPKQSFYQEMQKRGFPTKITRWCCDFLKKDPTKHIKINDRLMGIRAEESSRRSKRPQIDMYVNGQIVYKPIFYWKEWEIWEYIERYNLPYCSLYDEGFSRLGCVVCPFICGPKPQNVPWKLQLHKDRWPKIDAAFERALHKFYLEGSIPSMRKIRMHNNWRICLGYLEPVTWDIFRENWYLGKTNFYVKD